MSRFSRFALALVVGCFAMTATAGAAGYVTGKQIKDGTIGLVDLSAPAKRSLKGSAGPQGAQGPQGLAGTPGPQGATGPAGATGTAPLANVQTVTSTASVPPGEVVGVRAHCPPGKVVVGTGFFASLTQPGYVKSYGTMVGAAFVGSDYIHDDVEVQAICASTGQATAASARKALPDAFTRDLAQVQAAAGT